MWEIEHEILELELWNKEKDNFSSENHAIKKKAILLE